MLKVNFQLCYMFLTELIFSVPCGIYKSLNFTYRAVQKKLHTFRLWTVIPENSYLSVRSVFRTVYLLLLLYLILLKKKRKFRSKILIELEGILQYMPGACF